VAENNYEGNTNALKYKSEEELQKGIDEYFKDCEKRKKPYTMSGLAMSLGIHRETLTNYGKRDLFSALIEKAKQKIQQQLEENALDGTSHPGFTMFTLRVNYKWDDTTKMEITQYNPDITHVEEVVDNSNLEKVLYEANKPK
jgi:hypothetical protein